MALSLSVTTASTKNNNAGIDNTRIIIYNHSP